MSNSVLILDEQVLEVISGGHVVALKRTFYTANNSKTNNSTLSVTNFGMNAVHNFAVSGGAIGNIGIGVQQGNL